MTATGPASGPEAVRQAIRLLRRFADRVEWRREAGAQDTGVDIIGVQGRERVFAVEVKRLSGSNRIRNLKGAAAMAILELQRAAPDSTKIVWLHVDQLGTYTTTELATYLAEVAPDVAWAVTDNHGGLRIFIPELDVDVDQPSTGGPQSAVTHRPTLFSDLNSWMLKLLLMRNAPTRMWTATRELVRNAHGLHFVAEVSAATAHRFVKSMTEADFLRSDRRGLHLVRVEALLRSWRASYTSRPPSTIEARPLFDLDFGAIKASIAGQRAAIGGLIAAGHFGLLHATDGRQTVWVEAELVDAIDDLDLVRAEPGQGQLWIGQPRHKESVFRARVMTEHGAYVDPCQLMLECAADPIRGMEQSDYILDRIMHWQRDTRD